MDRRGLETTRTNEVNLKDFADIADGRDSAALESRLVQFAHELGFGIISAALVIEHGASEASSFAFGNIPPRFRERSQSREIAKRDPVMRRLKTWSVPFTYDQQMYVREGAADLWETQAAFGFKTGVAMALHLPEHRHFIVGVDRENALPNKEATMTRLMSELALLAVHAQEAASRIFAPAPDGDSKVSLVQREIECLRWRGEGKTAWETGRILNLSESRVNKICAAAAHKLGCVSTSQAAIRATRAGLLR